MLLDWFVNISYVCKGSRQTVRKDSGRGVYEGLISDLVR